MNFMHNFPKTVENSVVMMLLGDGIIYCLVSGKAAKTVRKIVLFKKKKNLI